MPIITGKVPEIRRAIQGVIDDFGKIYIFGGINDGIGQKNISKLFNDMIILNTKDLTWSDGPPVNTPLKRYSYTATLISNGMILYIGGHEQISNNTFREVDINQINLYDTKLASWLVMVSIYSKIYFFLNFMKF